MTKEPYSLEKRKYKIYENKPNAKFSGLRKKLMGKEDLNVVSYSCIERTKNVKI